jgi:ABC-type multidrug transport system fused ATPase/permease subunit
MQILIPTSGEILLQECEGGRALDNAKKNAFMREYISYVPQGNTLFSGTISQNLLLGKPGATKGEQITALKKAYAWDFVDKAEAGLNTVIGERGMGLSEGQAQRIAIARALLRNAPILILDEATSALDQETEKLVLEEIMMDNYHSLIMITHRTSILAYCNRLWRLDKGIITEERIDTSEVAATKAT